MSFQISDKVVCVDANFPPEASDRHSGLPIKGQVYVVRDCRVSIINGEPIVYIVGIIGGLHPVGEEFGFWSWRFRKLSDVKAENSTKRKEKAKP